MEEHDGGGGYSGGRRSLRYEFSREPNGSTASVTLGGILSIKETTSSSSSPSYRIHNRTLLDLIRTDPTTENNDSKKPWKMFRDKLRLKLSGSVCTTTVPILASLVHINTVTDNNRTTPERTTIQLNSPSVSNGNVNSNSNGNVNSNGNSSSVAVTQPENSTNMLNSVPVSNDNTGGVSDTQTENVRSEPTVKVSLMRLLEVDGSACFEDDDGDEVVVDGGDGGGGYNNCCVCMVRHKGAAFIPCGHTFCRLCSRELFVKRANCPLCNNFISEILDIF